jgi:hypothetical protein
MFSQVPSLYRDEYLNQSIDDEAWWKRSNKLMNIHALVRLDDMTDAGDTIRHTIQLEVRFFVQVILSSEDGEKCFVNEWKIGGKSFDGIAEQ